MTKRNSRTLFFALIAVLSACAGWFFCIRDSNRSFFVEHSGIHLPFGVTDTFHFTDFEFAMTSHYTLPIRARAAFAQRNHFSTIRPKDWEPIFHLADLPVPWNQIPTVGTLYYLTGADSATAWDAVFHLESGWLWTSIYFADSSGDLPGRVRPTSPNHALQRTATLAFSYRCAAVSSTGSVTASAPAMKPGTCRAFASRRRAHTRALGSRSLSLGSLGDFERLS